MWRTSGRRHRDAYMALAEQVGRDTLGARVAEGLQRGRPEHENFHAALRWSLDHADWGSALRLAASLAPYWFRIGLVMDVREWLERAVRHAAPGDPWRPRALLGRALLAHAAAAPEAFRVADEAVAACETSGDDAELLALALTWRARALLDQRRLAEARRDLSRASALGAQARSEEVLGFADQVRGCLQLEAGDPDGAAELLVSARDRYRRLRGGLDAGYTLVDLARVRLAQGRPRDACEVAGQALSDFRRREDPRGAAAAFVCLGRAHAALGEHERGRAALDAALGLAERWGLTAEAVAARAALAELGASGDRDKAGQRNPRSGLRSRRWPTSGPLQSSACSENTETTTFELPANCGEPESP